jgi:hypothetical protein
VIGGILGVTKGGNSTSLSDDFCNLEGSSEYLKVVDTCKGGATS